MVKVVYVMSRLYFRINMGSHIHSPLPEIASNLLLARQGVWNHLVGVFNQHIGTLREQISVQHPEVHLKLTSCTPQSAQWFEAIKDVRAHIRSADVDLNAKIAKILSEAPIWWQNKDELYADFIRAVRTNKYRLKPLHTRSGNGGYGGFNYRFQNPVNASQILDGSLPVKIRQEGRHGELTMPIHASGHGEYVTIQIPFTIHRDLTNYLIHGLKLICRKEGAQRKTYVSFLTSGPAPCNKVGDRPVIASVDMGWRITGSGMRVATACLDDGYFEELVLPAAWVLDMDYLADLSRHITGVAKEFALVHKLPAPVSWMAIRDFDGHWDQWGKQTQSMRNEYNNKQARLIRERLDIYHQFSARLAIAADVILIEDLNLKAMLLPTSDQGPEQKRQQRMAAVTVMQNTLENACRKRGKLFKQVKAYNSSTIHIECGHKNKPSRTNDICCGGCGEHYDQDRNAALAMIKGFSGH